MYGLVWIGRFLFLFSVSDFLVFEMILLQIPKLEFVSMFQNLSFKILNPNKKLTLVS